MCPPQGSHEWKVKSMKGTNQGRNFGNWGELPQNKVLLPPPF